MKANKINQNKTELTVVIQSKILFDDGNEIQWVLFISTGSELVMKM